MITTEQFIQDAIKTHGNKYDYTKTIYTGAFKKVTVTCRIHGDFSQEASAHKRHAGCPKCGQLSANSKNTLTKDKFLQLSNTVHKHFYSYDQVKFINATTKVDITCPVHGIFSQSPYRHMKGTGCSYCNKYFNAYRRSYYNNKKTIFYILKLPNNVYKIGITTRSIDDRYKFENSSYSIILEQHFFDGKYAWDLEKHVLKHFKQFKYQGVKLFKHTSNSELLTINPINYISQRIINEQHFT